MKSVNQAIEEVKNFPKLSLFIGLTLILFSISLLLVKLDQIKDSKNVYVYFDYTIIDSDTTLVNIRCSNRTEEFPYLDDYVWEDIPTYYWKDNGITYIPIKVNISK